MNTFVWFWLVLFHFSSVFAQGNTDSVTLPYPDLIPVLKNGLFGYCDKDLNVKIEPQYYQAGFFETDFTFQAWNVNNPDIIRFGSAKYAWVEDGTHRYRIDKKGNIVYQYKASDFKSVSKTISLDENENLKITDIDTTTLFQTVNDSLTALDVAFPDKTQLDILKKQFEKNPNAGISIIIYQDRKDIPITWFKDEEQQLQGVRNINTGQIVIEAKYTMLDLLFNDNAKQQWYPLLKVFSSGPKISSFYVGLNGVEYIID